MGIVGGLALAANLAYFLLYRHRGDNLNMSSTWLCSRNDLIANAGVLLAVGSCYLFVSHWPGIIVGTIIAGLFLSSALGVLRQSLHALRAPVSLRRSLHPVATRPEHTIRIYKKSGDLLK